MKSADFILQHRLLNREVGLSQHHDLVTKGCGNFLEGLPPRFPFDIVSVFPKSRDLSHSRLGGTRMGQGDGLQAKNDVVFGSDRYLREVEVGDYEEEERTSNEDVIVVFMDVCKCAGTGLGNYIAC